MDARIPQKLERFFWPPVENDEYLETASKRALIVFSIAALIIGAVVMARFVVGQLGEVPFYAELTIYSAPIYALFPILLYKGMSARSIGLAFCLYTGLRLAVLSLTLGGVDSTQTLFLIPLVLIGTFVLGIKQGIFGAGLALLLYVALFFTLDRNTMSAEDFIYMRDHLAQLSAVLIMVMGAGAIFRRELVGAMQNLELARKEAEASNQAKSEFLANMSHEIRTPMNGVLGMSDILKTTEMTRKQKSLVDTIDRSGNALLTIINDILDFSKIEAGQLELDIVPFDIRKATLEVRELLNTAAIEKNLRLKIHFDRDIPELVSGDGGRYRQILINLVGNAIKFTSEGQVSITLEAERTGEQVRIKTSVVDTGIGIPEDKAAAIFDKFAQVDSSTTRKFGGTGLGLTISNQLVHAMDGQLKLESSLGHGANFWFELDLPVVKPVTDTQSDGLSDLIRLPVLIVSADAACAGKLEHHLQAWGLKSIIIKSENNALEILKFMSDKQTGFPLMIVDNEVGENRAGLVFDFVKTLPVPVLSLCPNGADKTQYDVPTTRADGCLSKSFSVDELRRAVYILLMDGQTRELNAVPKQNPEMLRKAVA